MGFSFNSKIEIPDEAINRIIDEFSEEMLSVLSKRGLYGRFADGLCSVMLEARKSLLSSPAKKLYKLDGVCIQKQTLDKLLPLIRDDRKVEAVRTLAYEAGVDFGVAKRIIDAGGYGAVGVNFLIGRLVEMESGKI